MKKEYLKPYYYAVLQYKGLYKTTPKKYQTIGELKKAINGLYKNYITRDSGYPLIDYVIYECKPIERLLND